MPVTTSVNTPASCGIGGGVCSVCSGNTPICNNGTCQAAPCGPSNCASGCCQAGVCQPGNVPGACGTGGNTCNTCSGGTPACVANSCQAPACGPGNCAGCCQGGVCQGGSAPSACGVGGGSCSVCSGGTPTCSTGGSCVGAPPSCGPSNCATGCCEGTICRTGSSPSACGTGGQACQACPLQASCGSGVCFYNQTFPTGVIGATCTADSSCQNASGGQPAPQFTCETGFPTGYCAPDCATSGNPCLAGTCLNINSINICFANCTGPGTGRGSCRANYACAPLMVGGVPTLHGACFPDCRVAGQGCMTPAVCNSTSGLCN